MNARAIVLLFVAATATAADIPNRLIDYGKFETQVNRVGEER